jgi:hypothetical protein
MSCHRGAERPSDGGNEHVSDDGGDRSSDNGEHISDDGGARTSDDCGRVNRELAHVPILSQWRSTPSSEPPEALIAQAEALEKLGKGLSSPELSKDILLLSDSFRRLASVQDARSAARGPTAREFVSANRISMRLREVARRGVAARCGGEDAPEQSDAWKAATTKRIQELVPTTNACLSDETKRGNHSAFTLSLRLDVASDGDVDLAAPATAMDTGALSPADGGPALPYSFELVECVARVIDSTWRFDRPTGGAVLVLPLAHSALRN